MTQLTEAGAIICPAVPSFCSKPATITELIDTVVDRIVDLLSIDNQTYRWGDGKLIIAYTNYLKL